MNTTCFSHVVSQIFYFIFWKKAMAFCPCHTVSTSYLHVSASLFYLNPFILMVSYFIVLLRSKNLKTRVIGCPKTIDGDLKCKEVPTSFGFDTACKVNLTMPLSNHISNLICITLIYSCLIWSISGSHYLFMVRTWVFGLF